MSGATIRQFVMPVDVNDVLEISLWVRSVDAVEHPVQLLYSEFGGGGHTVRIDDAKIMVDDAVAAEASAWGHLKVLYR